LQSLHVAICARQVKVTWLCQGQEQLASVHEAFQSIEAFRRAVSIYTWSNPISGLATSFMYQCQMSQKWRTSIFVATTYNTFLKLTTRHANFFPHSCYEDVLYKFTFDTDSDNHCCS